PWGCGRCSRCRAGIENYCEIFPRGNPVGGLGLDGGMAEFLRVPSTRFMVPLRTLDPASAAPLADAALTPYHAIKRSGEVLTPGSTAVVIGVGGLGHLAVQILKATTAAKVVAVDTDDDKIQLAKELGADEAVSPDQAQEAVGDLSHNPTRRANVVLDFVGNEQTMSLAASCVGTLGHLTVVGLGMGTLPFNVFTLPYEVSVASTYWGSLPELFEVVALAEAGKIGVHIEKFPLEKAADAYDAMRSGSLRGRAVIVPNS
ncbi:MAG: zinc-binding dehydrogenase, partial [Acidimicrobiia bacterium]